MGSWFGATIDCMNFIFPRSRRLRRLAATLAFVPVGFAGCAGAEPAKPLPATAAPATVEPAAQPQAPEAESFRIVFLGDSLSAGFGLPESQAFPALVQEQLRERGHPVDVLNAGVSGDTTAGGLTRVDWVLRSSPDVLVVGLGGNDALRGQPLENTERNLADIVRRGRAAGARVVLLGMDVPTNYGAEYGREFADLYPRVAREEGAELVDGFMREVGLDPELLLADGLHPNAAGHRVLAERLVGVLERLAGISARPRS